MAQVVTDTDINNRKWNRVKKTINDNLVIAGLGGTGTWFAFLVSGITWGSKILLLDPDVLEPENLNRLPLPLLEFASRHMMKHKVSLVATYLALSNKDIRVYPYPVRADKETLDYLLDRHAISSPVIVDCTDNTRSTDELMDYAREKGYEYLGIHYDGSHITVEHRRPHQIGKGWIAREQTGYTVLPSYIVPPVIAAALAVDMLLYRIYGVISTDIWGIVDRLMVKQSWR